MNAWQRILARIFERARPAPRSAATRARGNGALRVLALLLLGPALLLGGCESGTDDAGDTGEVIIGLTDAEGDFVGYTVTLSALTLTRADGAVVDTLPLSTSVDFAQYTELTEILTAATVPTGSYVKATMTLDYSAADIRVENAAGDAVPVSDILDVNGTPIDGELVVDVHLQDRDRLVVRAGLPAHMTLDFDLQASNSVSFDPQGQPTLTVDPFLLADVELERPKIQRVRGPLASVNLDRSLYRVIIRPFHHALAGDHRRFGTLAVITTDDTVFDINNQLLRGAAGLEELARQPAFTATVAIGELKANPRRFEAREVYAGSSVPGGTLDVVQGTVRARTHDTLTVRGATLIRTGGSLVFNDDVTVRLAESTVVKKQFSVDAHGIDDISVGQRLRVFGTLIAPGELDAANGYARMLLSAVSGTRSDDPAQTDRELVVALQSMNGRRVSLYDFSGTGTDPGNDADPSAYQVDVATLDLGTIAGGAPLKVRGFPRPFGSAPADYEAQTVIRVEVLRAVLAGSWDPASASAVADLDASGMTLDWSGAGARHHVYRGGVAVDLATLPDPTVIAPHATGNGAFLLQEGTSRTLHLRFASFADDLQQRLDAGALVAAVHASGTFDDATTTMSARTLHMLLR